MDRKSKDHCTWFPEYWFGTYIGDCCEIHDEACSTSKFFKCLKRKIGLFGTILITTGGAIGCWFKYTKAMIKRI